MGPKRRDPLIGLEVGRQGGGDSIHLAAGRQLGEHELTASVLLVAMSHQGDPVGELHGRMSREAAPEVEGVNRAKIRFLNTDSGDVELPLRAGLELYPCKEHAAPVCSEGWPVRLVVVVLDRCRLGHHTPGAVPARAAPHDRIRERSIMPDTNSAYASPNGRSRSRCTFIRLTTTSASAMGL